MSIRWHESYKTCSHSNDDVCPTCDFDDYYAATYEDCPWRETDDSDSVAAGVGAGNPGSLVVGDTP